MLDQKSKLSIFALAISSGNLQAKAETICLASYRGDTAVTRSGIACQSWNTNTPNTVRYDLSASGGSNNNQCRNPDNDPGGPWCYKNKADLADGEPNWEYCDIPSCVPTTRSNVDVTRNSEEEGCLPDDEQGLNYQGTISRTEQGYICQAWDSNFPNEPSDHVRAKIPAGTSHNYCRNYDEDARPWCYVTNAEKKWDYCDIQTCARQQALEFSANSDELECGFFCECGKECYVGPTCDIVDGEKASEGQWPWQVHFRRSDGYGFCGGAVLNKNWVISAAHCFENFIAAEIFVAIGFHERDNHISSYSAQYGRQLIQAKRIIDHENYDTRTKVNDITLVELSRSIVYPITQQTIDDGSNYRRTLVRPICLPGETSNNKFESSLVGKAIASGWGRTSEGGERSDSLLFVDLNRIPAGTSTCRAWGNLDPQKQICADGDPGDSKDTCQGDSGGPLVGLSSQYGEQYALLGLTSYGAGCGEEHPGVYTRPSGYIDWIKRYTTNIQIIGD